MSATLTDPAQHMIALAEANRIRLVIAAWRRYVHALPHREGREYLAGLLDQEELGDLGSIKLGAALSTIRRVGPTGAQRIIRHALPEARNVAQKRLRDLTPRQREELAFSLRWQ